ncbi:MAG: type II toxin-antitoxin system RelB/DinJ family antitoxin [Limosilactobacillus mucosae]|nr:type II toxin-antitoxin system RelB/DinJ family antitoxin [Limosilactobacillus mucosae]
MTVRMDSDLKKSFDSLCAEFGLSSNAAMNIFARAVVQRGKIPFEIVSDNVAAAQRAQLAVDKFYEEKNLGLSDIESLLNEHVRTPYSRAKK